MMPASLPPERTNVIFDWPETVPGQSPCEPGHYVGRYACHLVIGVNENANGFELSGMIDLQLEQSTDGERLRVANGKFQGDAAAVIPLTADVLGELSCSEHRFEGRLENGMFSVALGLDVPFTQGTFMGQLTSSYDPMVAGLVDGKWNTMGELDLIPGTCTDGTWSAQRVP